MGVPEFQQVVTSAPRESVVNQDLSSSTTILAGDTENIDIYSSSGTIAELIAFYFSVQSPTGATAGTHFLNLRTTVSTSGVVDLAGQSVYSSTLYFDYSCWQTADSWQRPASDTAQGQAMRGVKFDNQVGLRLNYSNQTDKDQTKQRNIEIRFLEKEVGE